ncbi:MAG: 50S ribosomal protein L21 [Firmicutes bacterium]|uniref:50S ribosomal protein L21 n=1 Tax=Kallipyga massiliensis TaxID=1472764 RepID=UPI0004B034C8|nr:50S ribosomal protein L21 [Kallipyga massiliensis]MDD7732348.1 50S ribosomal protein L21 [Bacillota bacterium]
MYAVIKTGGKQYQVEEGQVLRIEKVKGEVGDKIALDQVLVIGGDSLKVGKPFLEGAKVEATIKAQDKAKKVIVGKFKAKKGYKRKQGHRQPYTLISIDQIQG